MFVRLSTLAVAANLLSPTIALSAGDIPSDLPVSQLLSSAQAHLSKGQTSDALVYYDAAIARDPSDYLTFFKRATTHLSLGRTSQASEDFNQVLLLKPGFEGAHVQLGRLKSRAADWEGAREQYTLAKKGAGSDEFVQLEEASGASTLAEAAEKSANWDECISQADVAIAVANRAVHLRELRSRCRFAKGEIKEGMGDLYHILNLRPGDTSPHIKVSAIAFYALGELEKGMGQSKKCLHSDPDSKVCKKLLKQEKAVDKVLAKVAKAMEKNQPMTGVKPLLPAGSDEGLIKQVKEQVKMLRDDGTIPATAPNHLISRLVSYACQGYYEMNNMKKGKAWCDEALELDGDSFYALLSRAKSQMEAEEYESALQTLQKANEVGTDKQEIVSPLLQKAQVALKRSKTKDYYKVLGVDHDADERQIKSAYRKLSKKHHPDKAASQGITKEDAQKKMASINEAYEVLSDPELRARFDRGDDPNSHEQQQNQYQGHPFGGGHPFMFQQGGGSGGSFKFQFGGNNFQFGG